LKPQRKSKRNYSLLKLMIPLIFIIAVMWVWKANEVNRLSRKLTELEKRRNDHAEQNKFMKAELEKYRSLAWIEPKARLEFGMTHDIKNRIVLFDQTTGKPAKNQSLFAGVLDFMKQVIETLLKNK
jgi:cell division protein FtsB